MSERKSRLLQPVTPRPIESLYPPDVVEESKWLAFDRKLVAKRWTMNDPEVEAMKMELTWDTLAGNLHTRSRQNSNPIEKEKFRTLASVARACGLVFNNLSTRLDSFNLSHDEKTKLARLIGERDSAVSEDTYPSHGARCASYIVDMGITDTEAFMTAGLHDLAEVFADGRAIDPAKTFSPKVKRVVKNVVESAFRAHLPALPSEEKSRLIASLSRFHEIDEAGRAIAIKVSETMENDLSLPFGKEFSLGEFTSMRDWLWSNGVKKAHPDRRYDKQGERVNFGIDKDEVKSSDKFEPLITVLGRASSDIGRETAKRKGVEPVIPISSELAYLAAALDHSYFPKTPEASSEDAKIAKQKSEQKVALGIMANHIPIYQAYGDPMRRLAQEIVYRAFMPEKFGNLYRVADGISRCHDGKYFEINSEVYANYLYGEVATAIYLCKVQKAGSIDVKVLSDIEWEDRRVQYLNGHISELLASDEAYVPGYTRHNSSQDNGAQSSVPWYMRVVDIKSAASIMTKVIDKCATPKNREGLNPALRAILGPNTERFGTYAFWDQALLDQHDPLRSLIVTGESVHPKFMNYLQLNTLNLKYDAARKLPDRVLTEVGEYKMYDDYVNNARSMYDLPDPESRRKEFLEWDRENRRSLHFIYAPRCIQKGDGYDMANWEYIEPLNLELHYHVGDVYAENFLEPLSFQHAAYKHAGRAERELSDESARTAYMAEVGRRFLDLERKYLNFERGNSNDMIPDIDPVEGRVYSSGDGSKRRGVKGRK